MNLRSFSELTRIDHALLLAVAVVVGGIIASLEIPSLNLIFLASLCPFFIEIGSFSLNDYLDFETDRINKRTDRPLVRGDVSLKTALLIPLIAFPAGLLSAFLINSTCFLVALFFAFIAIAYDFFLKKIAFIGNLVIGMCMAIPFIFGNFAVSEKISPAVLVLVGMAFLLGIGREIIKSIQDLTGDKKQERKTLPVIIGERKSAFISVFFILSAVIISPLPFFYLEHYFFDFYYLVPILVTDLLLISSTYYTLRLEKFVEIRRFTLFSLFTGLIGFLLGAVF